MWFRTLRLIWWLFFLWAAALGFRHGSWAWVIVPLFSMGCLFIARAYVEKHYPEFGAKLNVALLFLLLTYNIGFTLWPFMADKFPWTAAAIRGQSQRADLERGLDWDAGPVRARENIARYRQMTADAEADSIGRGLDELLVKRKQGTFGPSDAARERELLLRYKGLIQQSEELRKLVGAQHEGRQPEPAPRTSIGVLNNEDQRTKPLTGQPTPPPIRNNAPSPTSATRESNSSSAEQLDSLLNAQVASDNPQMGLMIVVTDGAEIAEQLIYASLRQQTRRVALEVFRSKLFKDQGFFGQIDSGNTTSLVESRAFQFLSKLVLGRVSSVCQNRTALDKNLLTCDVRLTTKTFNRTGALIDVAFFSATHAGFSEIDALDGACQKVSSALARYLE